MTTTNLTNMLFFLSALQIIRLDLTIPNIVKYDISNYISNLTPMAKRNLLLSIVTELLHILKTERHIDFDWTYVQYNLYVYQQIQLHEIQRIHKRHYMCYINKKQITRVTTYNIQYIITTIINNIQQ